MAIGQGSLFCNTNEVPSIRTSVCSSRGGIDLELPRDHALELFPLVWQEVNGWKTILPKLPVMCRCFGDLRYSGDFLRPSHECFKLLIIFFCDEVANIAEIGTSSMEELNVFEMALVLAVVHVDPCRCKVIYTWHFRDDTSPVFRLWLES